MALNLLIDTNVALDVILKREPFFAASKRAVDLQREYDVTEFVSAATVTDIYYIARRQLRSHEVVMDLLKEFLQTVRIADVTDDDIYTALALNRKDFEDSVQYAVAKSNGFDGIVTRNMQGFVDDEVKIFTPEEFCAYMEKNFGGVIYS